LEGQASERDWLLPLEDTDFAREHAKSAAAAVEPGIWLSSMATALMEQKRELLAVREELARLRDRVEALGQEGGEGNREQSSRPLTWRKAHAEEFRKHAGRYVAWGDQGIAASGETYAEVLRELNQLGNPRGLGIEYVPRAPRIRR